MTISLELRTQILRLHQVERWPAGTIARQLQVHRDAVKRLLNSSELVSTIAFEEGFGDLSTFNAQFRRQYGLSPLRFRERHQ
jgi:AraC-like DNA-binding protein